jgi:RND family efflux transporter MFP subunit
MKKFLTLASIVLFSTTLLGCGTQTENIVVLPATETFLLHTENFTPTLSLTGTIEAQKSIALSSKISGRIDTLLVEIGNTVTKDQIVAQLSAFDDQTQIAYNNALSQFKTTEISGQSAVQSAETAVLNAQQQHEQNQRQEQANIQQLLDTLNARTNASHTVIDRILSFLDMTLGASPQFQYGSNSSVVVAVGNTDTIGKQNTKNEIAKLIQSKETRAFPYSPDPIGNTRQEINLLKQVQTVTQSFYGLIRNTPVTSSFSESQRQGIQQTTERYLGELSGEILALETQMRATQTAQEQLGLGLVQTQNAIENAESQLKLAQANSGQQVQIARNQIVSAKNMQNELELKAPFDGIITQKFVDEGALIAPGSPVFQLADRSVLKIYTEIPDTYIGSIAEEMLVQINVDGISDTFNGKITRIDPAVNPSTRTLGIEITLDESPEKIRLGMFARIKVELPEKTAFFVPKRFIQSAFEGSFVTTKNGESIAVKLGEEKDGLVEISADKLEEGFSLLK